MRLEWFTDLLAIIENDSLSRAADKRFVSQSAFSRRIKVIEEYVGAELLDRSCKPAQLKPRVLEQKHKIHELVNGIHDLIHEFQRIDDGSEKSLVIACPYSIATAVGPTLIKQVYSKMNINIHLRSANRDGCYALLITKKADIMLVFTFQDEYFSSHQQFLNQCDLGYEYLIPVYASSRLAEFDEKLCSGEIDIVTYRSNVFLRSVMNSEVYPVIREDKVIRRHTETELTMAALQCALEGLGVAWLPKSLIGTQLANNQLTELSDRLPWVRLSVTAVRTADTKSAVENEFWEIVTATETSG